MKTKLFKTSVALFFLLLFTSGKAFGYHMLLHNHDIQITECEVCDKALADQFSPLDNVTQQPETKEIQKEFLLDVIVNYSSELHTTELFTALFSRPPPFMN
jgi:hypothetical protein